ncbi:MAG: hypothetical protein G01um101413_208 [Parcubacteria group bacterium Gr01-1014_13]|nr:MAG: hypothetical protein G01um101413_208 [Parcubacteria group bacterium Gr01-1014_13]
MLICVNFLPKGDKMSEVKVWLVGVDTFDKKGRFIESIDFRTTIKGNGLNEKILALSQLDQAKIRTVMETKIIDKDAYKIIRKIMPSLPRKIVYHTIHVKAVRLEDSYSENSSN